MGNEGSANNRPHKNRSRTLEPRELDSSQLKITRRLPENKKEVSFETSKNNNSKIRYSNQSFNDEESEEED